jgi:hypothetical protein
VATVVLQHRPASLFFFLCFSVKRVKCWISSTLQLSPTVQGGKTKSRRKKGKEIVLERFLTCKFTSGRLGLWLLAVSAFRGFWGVRPKRKKSLFCTLHMVHEARLGAVCIMGLESYIYLPLVLTSLPCIHQSIQAGILSPQGNIHKQCAKRSTHETIHCLQFWALCALRWAFMVLSLCWQKSAFSDGRNLLIFALLVKLQARNQGISPLFTVLVELRRETTIH